jgi:hypothetical protein
MIPTTIACDRMPESRLWRVLAAGGAIGFLLLGAGMAETQHSAGLKQFISGSEIRETAAGPPRTDMFAGSRPLAIDGATRRRADGGPGRRDAAAFHERVRTHLPRYQAFVKDAAGRHGVDWRLVAALIYQESRMNPLARGPNGAMGLMQILPATARSLELADPYDPVANIRAGVRYLRSLYDQLEGVAPGDRLALALAAYNAGPGHVADARRLASKMGLDPDRWESVATTLPLLRLRRYYREAEQGFCRGDITVAYVTQILTYHDLLQRRELGTTLARAETGGLGSLVD